MSLAQKNNDSSIPSHHVQNFPVVGIGASAGGLDAFKILLKAIPKNSGMAYVLVQHLSASQESLLPEILTRVTPIPVHEIVDEIQLSPDHIYILPPNKIVTNRNGQLFLTPRIKKIRNFPIDIFLTTLAEVHKELAIGIVLSGTGTDGTSGLKAIKDYGGITIAEEPGSAAFDGMPVNAINANVVDYILPPEAIPQQLLKLRETITQSDLFPSIAGKQPVEDEVFFRQIISLLQQRSGIDFTYYKQPTQLRRIARRMALSNHKILKNYLEFLRGSKGEQDILVQDMLIPVTSFFRDPKALQLLCEKALPLIIRNKTVNEPIRIWVAGCSTGQEAFSMAICLHEFLYGSGTSRAKHQVQIFATDVSEPAIIKARNGSYSQADLAGVSEERLRQYFRKTDGHWQVNKVIRDCIVFAQHNFLKDPPFGKMDLISCRNSLIYMDNFLQRKALNTFHYSLNDNGILLLGKSETTTPASELFAPYNKQEKIYTRKAVPGRPRFANTERHVSPELQLQTQTFKTQEVQTDFRKNAEALLLAKYTPAAVIINEAMDIVHIHGDTTPYLQPHPGKPTFNLLKMVKDSLAFELRSALHKSKTSKSTVEKHGIPVPYSSINEKGAHTGTRLVSFEVAPLDSIEPHTLVMFKETLTKDSKATAGKGKEKREGKNELVEQLEKELAQTRADMRSITEEQEAANEELQSANEELQSSSEELQSLNEELETSKEELQSTNEELVVINQELIEKQDQLNNARLYAENIISTIREPLLVLDTRLLIRTANAAFYKKFRLSEAETEGHALTQLQNKLWNIQTLTRQLLQIGEDNIQVSDFEIEIELPYLGKRYLELNAKRIENDSNSEHLILLIIGDITDRKLNAKLLQEAKTRSLAAMIRQMIWTAAADGEITFLNNYTIEYSGLKLGELIEDVWLKLISPLDIEKTAIAWKKCLQNGTDLRMENRIRAADGTYAWHLSQGFAEKDSQGKISGWVLSHTEIHAQKMREQDKDDFISIASHELKTPLTGIKGYAQLLQEHLGHAEDPEAKMLSGKLTKQVDRLSVLVKDLLDATNVQEGNMKLHFRDVNIDDLIKEVVEMMHGVEQNRIIVTNLKAGKVIQADRERILQAITNMVGNAIKYSPKTEKIIITSTATAVSIKVCVQDFGVGIAEHAQQKIFDRFYRVKDKMTNTLPGMGLGLYITAQIVKNHGGKVEVISKKGDGSTFCFIIPLSGKAAAFSN